MQNVAAVSIFDQRAKNKAAQAEAALITHIEERLRMMDAYTPAERAKRRRGWAADIVAAIPALRGERR